MVVHRIPARCDVRLADDERSVVRVQEAGALERLRNAAVADDDGEVAPFGQAALRRDGELAAFTAPERAAPVHDDGVDRQPDEIEVEARQVLGRGGTKLGLALEEIRRRVVLHLEVVVADVVAAVPVKRKIRIAGARRARDELPSAVLPRGSRPESQDDGDARQKQRAERAPPPRTHRGPSSSP